LKSGDVKSEKGEPALKLIVRRLVLARMRFVYWVNRGKPFWLFTFWATVVTLVSFALAYQLCFELSKSIGTGFELIGIFYVFRQINSKRTTFGRPTFFNGVVSWVKEFPKIFAKPQDATFVGGTAFGSISQVARMRAAHGSVSNSVFDRLDAVEKNLARNQQEMDQLQLELDKAKSELKAELRQEVATRSSEDTRIFESMKNLAVSDSELEYLGLFFVATGVIISNFSGWTLLVFKACSLH
jgi:hypothetical protein